RLGEILGLLRDAYCRTVGVEYMHIQEPDQKRWIQEQVEDVSVVLDLDEQRHVLERLNAAEAFERFLHTKYTGHKRFGLEGAEIPITLASNPSHLEAVDPVVEGMVRAKQDLIDAPETFSVLSLLVHGDAAFAGQGVVAETLNLSQLRGYRTGGTIHLVINNQVGFTTAPEAARSSVYPTDIAKTVQAPRFHVNGDDPEACVRVARLAFG